MRSSRLGDVEVATIVDASFNTVENRHSIIFLLSTLNFLRGNPLQLFLLFSGNFPKNSDRTTVSICTFPIKGFFVSNVELA